MLVFAYGSNMDLGQMMRRCPGAMIVGRAILYGRHIAFSGWSQLRGGAVATIIPMRGGRVPGVVYAISDDNLKMLDEYEGYPTTYHRERVRVKMVKGSHVAAWAYVLSNPSGSRAPGINYFEQIRYGYRLWKFSERHVTNLYVAARAYMFGKKRQLNLYDA